MITEDYCSYEVAKLLKEKGFDEKCIAYYPQCITPIKLTFGGRVNYNASNKFKMLSPISAPTHQMAMKWLREVHNIHIIARPYTNTEGQHWGFIFDKYTYDCWQELAIYITDSWNSYEKAVEVAIKYCLEKLI